MNNGPMIFLALLFTMLWSYYGFVVRNFKEVGRQEPVETLTGGRYPSGRSGTANLGQEVYRANGCAACHTMQVRTRGYGADLERGWGTRNTVLRDFIYDNHVFLGQTRIGPDLANVGARPYATPEWHLLHLYNPRLLVKGSLMPQYPYLFEQRKVRGQRSANALALPAGTVKEDYEVVPTREATALVQYLTSLNAETAIFEAPLNPKPKPKPTNETAQASAAQPSDTSAASTNK
jgi:cytochrome c oxidase cbb3-type subunit II